MSAALIEGVAIAWLTVERLLLRLNRLILRLLIWVCVSRLARVWIYVSLRSIVVIWIAIRSRTIVALHNSTVTSHIRLYVCIASNGRC